MAEETEGKALESDTSEAGVRNALGDSNRALYFIAEVDRTVAGQTMITPEWSDWRNGFVWWIQSVYIKPEYRRQGVFRALYEHVAKLAKRRPDVCGLRLYVHCDNETAIETYRNLGMSQTDYLLFEEEFR
jgi:ribosomal protein S18 acetylase RimI-like enzyme